jgi:hypothetical protein
MPHAQASPQSRNQTGHVFQRRDAEIAEISAEKTDLEEAEFFSPFVELAFASLRLSLRSLRLCVEHAFSYDPCFAGSRKDLAGTIPKPLP